MLSMWSVASSGSEDKQANKWQMNENMRWEIKKKIFMSEMEKEHKTNV